MPYTSSGVPLKVGSKFWDMEAKSLSGKEKTPNTTGEQFSAFLLCVPGNF
jgi:hypothetical protein